MKYRWGAISRQLMIISSALLSIAENLVGAYNPAEFHRGISVFCIDIGMNSLGRAQTPSFLHDKLPIVR
jgi:hypothetical protein